MTCKVCGEDKPVSQMGRRRIRERINGVKVVDYAAGWQPTQPCRACRKEYSAAYRAANPERVAASDARYKEENSELYRAYYADYHRKNAEKRRAQAAARYAAKKDLLREQALAWRERNREHLRAYGRMVRTRRRYTDPATQDYITVLYSDPCSSCGGPTTTVDHIEPSSAGGSNLWDNLTAACKPCNSRKRTKPLLTFLREVA